MLLEREMRPARRPNSACPCVVASGHDSFRSDFGGIGGMGLIPRPVPLGSVPPWMRPTSPVLSEKPIEGFSSKTGRRSPPISSRLTKPATPVPQQGNVAHNAQALDVYHDAGFGAQAPLNIESGADAAPQRKAASSSPASPSADSRAPRGWAKVSHSRSSSQTALHRPSGVFLEVKSPEFDGGFVDTRLGHEEAGEIGVLQLPRADSAPQLPPVPLARLRQVHLDADIHGTSSGSRSTASQSPVEASANNNLHRNPSVPCKGKWKSSTPSPTTSSKGFCVVPCVSQMSVAATGR